MPYTEFHYTPTGTGVISGKEVLEQTEDAINDLGGQISGDVQTAINTANNALNTANTASADAQNAVNTANTAYTAATNAQNTANTAQNTASNALTAAQNAQNDVNALGNRVTTAEGNITQNTNAITGLTTRMGTAEGNITTLQNDVITAQGTATSAQNTATLARGQAYVVRYASVAVSDNSTVPYTDLSNIDNVKANDLLLDTNGKLYQISSVDTSNETVSVTTPLTQLAVDSGVMHLSGNESASGDKNFQGLLTTIPNSSLWPAVSNTSDDITLLGRSVVHLEQLSSGRLTDLSGGAWNVVELGAGAFFFRNNTGTDIRYKHLDTGVVSRIPVVSGTNRFINDVTPNQDNTYDLGSSSLRWKTINGLNPSSLGMPDLNNGIDISSYITVNGGNKESFYTPTVNGWISVALTRTGGANMAVMLKQGNITSSGHRIEQENATATCNATLPVKGGVQVSINSALADGIAFAYFYPCLGNV